MSSFANAPGAMNLAKQMGLDPDNLDDLARPAPAPAPDAVPSLTGKSSHETLEGEEDVRTEGWWHPSAGDKGKAAAAEAAAPTLAPAKLAAVERSAFVETLPFESFALSDEGKKITLYFGLKGARATLGKDAVVATFRTQALEVTATRGTSKFRFHESILFEHTVPAKCKVRVKTDHVVVILWKVFAQAHWESISVNRKAVGPVRTSPPDFGAPTIVTASGEAPAP